MIYRIIATLVLAGLVGLGPAMESLAQGARPDLPWTIAFIRDRNVWLMDGNGANQREFAPMGNVTGRLAWRPDGKLVVFARQGEMEYTLPDGGGGRRRMYDLFAKHVDSTRLNAWYWVTNNHGSHSPEYSSDGKYILYVHDLNANTVDAELPDYEMEYRNWEGTEVRQITREGAAPREAMGLQPTWNPDRSKVAFIYLNDRVPEGLVIEPTSGITRSEAELKAAAEKVPNCFGPCWSPDGEWIAYVNTEEDDNGIYLVDPETLETKKILNAAGAITPHQAPVSWSPDSKWIAFATIDGFIYIVGADGSGPHRLTSGGNDYYPSIAPK